MADTDPTQSDNPEGADRPEWLPENFKTPDDFAASYKEAQRKITEEATARRNLEAIVAQQNAAIEQLQAATAQPQQEEQWDDWYTQDPIATQRALAEQTAQQQIAPVTQQFSQQYQQLAGSQAEITAALAFNQLRDEKGDLNETFKEEMASIINAHPYLVPAEAYQSPTALKNALSVVYDLAEKKVGPQEPAGPSQDDLRRLMKLQAQSLEAPNGRTPSPDDAVKRWEEIQNAPTRKFSDL